MVRYDLEKRTTEYAKRVIRLCNILPKNGVNARLAEQAVGSAGSVGANYREANDALGKKDFLFRLKIARKEVKESTHWLELIAEANIHVARRMNRLLEEGTELRNILSAIIKTASSK